MIDKLLWVAVGILSAFVWRFVRERGHAVFGVKDKAVQELLTRVVRQYTTLRPLNIIHSGPTHQQVFSGGTVVLYFNDKVPPGFNPVGNVRSYVVWGKRKRIAAAQDLVTNLRRLGYEATVQEPLQEFPPGTFFLVRSNAFIDNGQAFRPHWIRMVYLQIKAKQTAQKRNV
jgi:hypothetical protein